MIGVFAGFRAVRSNVRPGTASVGEAAGPPGRRRASRRRTATARSREPVVDDAEHRVVRPHVLDEVAGADRAGRHDAVQRRAQDRLGEPRLGHFLLGARRPTSPAPRRRRVRALVDLLLRGEARFPQLLGPLAFASGPRWRPPRPGGTTPGRRRRPPWPRARRTEKDVPLLHPRPLRDEHLVHDPAGSAFTSACHFGSSVPTTAIVCRRVPTETAAASTAIFCGAVAALPLPLPEQPMRTAAEERGEGEDELGRSSSCGFLPDARARGARRAPPRRAG